MVQKTLEECKKAIDTPRPVYYNTMADVVWRYGFTAPKPYLYHTFAGFRISDIVRRRRFMMIKEETK